MSDASDRTSAALALVEAAQAVAHAAPASPPADLDVEHGWRVETLEDADWALSRIRDLKAEQEENHALWRRAERRIAAMNERAQRGIDFFEAHVLAWMDKSREVVLKRGRRKSRDLINGTIGWRSTASGLEVHDEEALLAWAMEQEPTLGLVRVVTEPNLAAIKEHARANNLVPPGMREREVKDEPYVKPDLKDLVLATRRKDTT